MKFIQVLELERRDFTNTGNLKRVAGRAYTRSPMVVAAGMVVKNRRGRTTASLEDAYGMLSASGRLDQFLKGDVKA